MNKARCIITIGQSNMQWANNGDIDDTSPIDWVYIIGRTSSSTTSTFEPLTPNTNTMGSWWGIWPEVWLAREFKRTRSEDLYIIKVAWSWTQISQKTWSNDWNVLSTGELVDMTKWYIDDAIAYFLANNIECVFDWFVIQQWEADTKIADHVNFMKYWNESIDALTAHAGIRDPFISFWLLADDTSSAYTYLDSIIFQQKLLVNNRKQYYVDPNEMDFQSDKVHYTNKWYLQLGKSHCKNYFKHIEWLTRKNKHPLA